MSVHRVMGIETEYGITVPGHPTMNAMVSSTHIVNAYAQEVIAAGRRKARWDYDLESPLRDARGFDMSRADADPSQLTDDDLGLANVVAAMERHARGYHGECWAPAPLLARLAAAGKTFN